MPTVSIALEDGFQDDHVVIMVDGRVVFDDARVSTMTQVGLASLASAETDRDQSRVAVSLPERGIEAAADLDLRQGPNVRVSLVGDQLDIRAGDLPLHYA